MFVTLWFLLIAAHCFAYIVYSNLSVSVGGAATKCSEIAIQWMLYSPVPSRAPSCPSPGPLSSALYAEGSHPLLRPPRSPSWSRPVDTPSLCSAPTWLALCSAACWVGVACLNARHFQAQRTRKVHLEISSKLEAAISTCMTCRTRTRKCLSVTYKENETYWYLL